MSTEDERMARDVAHIIGEGSAAAQALRELTQLRSAGYVCELSHIHAHTGGSWVIQKLRPAPVPTQ